MFLAGNGGDPPGRAGDRHPISRSRSEGLGRGPAHRITYVSPVSVGSIPAVYLTVPPPLGARVRILIADDHNVVRSGLRGILEAQPGWMVCGEASTGREAVAMTVNLKPDLVVLDISMPDLNGIQAAREIRRAASTPILFMTMHDAPDFQQDAVAAGATGFLPKTGSAQMIVDAVRAVLARKTFFPGAMAEPEHRLGELGESRKLTPREREVLQLLAEGCTNKQVASRLGITTKTAETHRSRIMAKLDLHSVSSLVRYALRHRIIDA